MIDDGLRSAGEAAVEMAIVGGEDDPIVADDIDDVRELLLIGFAGEIKLLALQKFTRLGLQGGQLDAENFEMLVHSPEPVGEPAAAGFQKHKAQFGKAIEHAFADDDRQRDHLLERMAEKVRVKKLINALRAGGVRAISSQEHVNADRHIQSFGLGVKRKIIR